MLFNAKLNISLNFQPYFCIHLFYLKNLSDWQEISSNQFAIVNSNTSSDDGLRWEFITYSHLYSKVWKYLCLQPLIPS